MPALITHHLFGEESIELLPAGIISSHEERVAFLIANQGPDPFFFHLRTLNFMACLQLGQVMHRKRITRQFAALREGTERLRHDDAGIGRAFVLGLLSHYVLDRTAHPFVYAQQWGIQAADPDLERAGSQVHAVIEGDLDVLMMQLKRGATVIAYPPVDELETSERVNRVAGALMSVMARRVYGLTVSAAEYGGAVADMRLFYRIVEPAGTRGARIVGRLEGLARDYALTGALAHRATMELPRGAGNLDGRLWENPFTGETSTESFPEVFDRALKMYRVAAERLVDGGDLTKVTMRLNYSGRVLDATEECDIAD